MLVYLNARRAELMLMARLWPRDSAAARRCYTDCVPREVLLPSGPPDRLVESRSGTFIEAPHARPPRPPVNLAQHSGYRDKFLSSRPPEIPPA